LATSYEIAPKTGFTCGDYSHFFPTPKAMAYRKQKTRLSAFEVYSYGLWGMKSNGTKMYVATAIPAND
ncbi:hypothetical protein, partial [Escherichia coli]|uniref:hypothetical protein n=1 Tax=Escherichia coli TaxID=562 RepID=UPI001BDCC957